jgi:hypothetical protein
MMEGLSSRPEAALFGILLCGRPLKNYARPKSPGGLADRRCMDVKREVSSIEYRRYHTGARALIVTFFVVLFGIVPPANALDQATVDNLQAAVRALSFLESLAKEGNIVVGVVYPSDIPTSEDLAAQAAKVIASMRGPNSRTLQPIVLSTNNLAQFGGHLDVLFLLAGTAKHSDAIVSTMRLHHLVSISDDPLCVDSNCCVLMVHTGQRVEISLNTALADVVGARFSLVFMMVVKRK